MERANTPPPQRATRSTPYSPPTPEVKRRIVSCSSLIIYNFNATQEENRLKAKALRERSLAAQHAAEASSTTGRTPSGFITTDINVAGRKRAHDAISIVQPGPSTVRDASRPVPADKDTAIQAARKFRRQDYIDHDFSAMTDTKGGFLSVEDDPHNKALHAPEKDGGRPAHMTLKEWERHQLLKGLRNRKEGPFEPGILRGDKMEGKKCRDCGSMEIDWQWEEVFKCCVCAGCKEKMPEKYSLLTKTEVAKDYLLTTRKFCCLFARR
jgi:DNA-repair protein complementing XP-A cells